jgi:hypothetical protein
LWDNVGDFFRICIAGKNFGQLLDRINYDVPLPDLGPKRGDRVGGRRDVVVFVKLASRGYFNSLPEFVGFIASDLRAGQFLEGPQNPYVKRIKRPVLGIAFEPLDFFGDQFGVREDWIWGACW